MLTILIIEDNLELINLLEIYIKLFQPVNINYALTNAQAFHSLKEETPDIVLIDLLLTNEISTPIIEYLNTNYRIRPIIAVITGLADGENLVAKQKVDYYLKKPFDLDQIKQILDRGKK